MQRAWMRMSGFGEARMRVRAPFFFFAGVAATLAGLAGFAAPAGAQDEPPAVSGPNVKFSASGGATEGDGLGLFNATGTVPVGERFGFQLDGTGGVIDDDAYWGVGGHFFWRNPELGLVGAFASQEARDKIDMQRYGAGGEIYLGPFTLAGRVGFQGGDVSDTPFGGVDARFYITPDLVLSGGTDLTDDTALGRGTLEFRPGWDALPGLAFFVNGEAGDADYDLVRGGFKLYFGKHETLRDRHRFDDPESPFPSNLKELRRDQRPEPARNHCEYHVYKCQECFCD